MQKIAVEKSRLHIPLIFGLDIIHGYRTEFPVPLGLSATWDPALVEQSGARRCERSQSVQECAGPTRRWWTSRVTHAGGGSSRARAKIPTSDRPWPPPTCAATRARSCSDPDSIAACTKHFVGYGAAEGGRDYNTAEIPMRLLRQVYLPPFQATVDAGAATFMSAFESLNEVPASANAFTLTQVLRKEWDFKGFVVSDWNSIGELIPQGVANSGAVAAGKAILAGVDMDMESNVYAPHLADLVKSGVVTESVVDESVRRVLRVKLALGLFDHPYTDVKR